MLKSSTTSNIPLSEKIPTPSYLSLREDLNQKGKILQETNFSKNGLPLAGYSNPAKLKITSKIKDLQLLPSTDILNKQIFGYKKNKGKYEFYSLTFQQKENDHGSIELSLDKLLLSIDAPKNFTPQSSGLDKLILSIDAPKNFTPQSFTLFQKRKSYETQDQQSQTAAVVFCHHQSKYLEYLINFYKDNKLSQSHTRQSSNPVDNTIIDTQKLYEEFASLEDCKFIGTLSAYTFFTFNNYFFVCLLEAQEYHATHRYMVQPYHNERREEKEKPYNKYYAGCKIKYFSNHGKSSLDPKIIALAEEEGSPKKTDITSHTQFPLWNLKSEIPQEAQIIVPNTMQAIQIIIEPVHQYFSIVNKEISNYPQAKDLPKIISSQLSSKKDLPEGYTYYSMVASNMPNNNKNLAITWQAPLTTTISDTRYELPAKVTMFTIAGDGETILNYACYDLPKECSSNYILCSTTDGIVLLSSPDFDHTNRSYQYYYSYPKLITPSDQEHQELLNLLTKKSERKETRLSTLDLCDWPLTLSPEILAQKICTIIKNNEQTLTTLGLANTKPQDVTIVYKDGMLPQALRENYNITKIIINDNQISPSDRERLKFIMDLNVDLNKGEKKCIDLSAYGEENLSWLLESLKIRVQTKDPKLRCDTISLGKIKNLDNEQMASLLQIISAKNHAFKTVDFQECNCSWAQKVKLYNHLKTNKDHSINQNICCNENSHTYKSLQAFKFDVDGQRRGNKSLIPGSLWELLHTSALTEQVVNQTGQTNQDHNRKQPSEAKQQIDQNKLLQTLQQFGDNLWFLPEIQKDGGLELFHKIATKFPLYDAAQTIKTILSALGKAWNHNDYVAALQWAQQKNEVKLAQALLLAIPYSEGKGSGAGLCYISTNKYLTGKFLFDCLKENNWLELFINHTHTPAELKNEIKINIVSMAQAAQKDEHMQKLLLLLLEKLCQWFEHGDKDKENFTKSEFAQILLGMQETSVRPQDNILLMFATNQPDSPNSQYPRQPQLSQFQLQTLKQLISTLPADILNIALPLQTSDGKNLLDILTSHADSANNANSNGNSNNSSGNNIINDNIINNNIIKNNIINNNLNNNGNNVSNNSNNIGNNISNNNLSNQVDNDPSGEILHCLLEKISATAIKALFSTQNNQKDGKNEPQKSLTQFIQQQLLALKNEVNTNEHAKKIKQQNIDTVFAKYVANFQQELQDLIQEFKENIQPIKEKNSNFYNECSKFFDKGLTNPIYVEIFTLYLNSRDIKGNSVFSDKNTLEIINQYQNNLVEIITTVINSIQENTQFKDIETIYNQIQQLNTIFIPSAEKEKITFALVDKLLRIKTFTNHENLAEAIKILINAPELSLDKKQNKIIDIYKQHFLSLLLRLKDNKNGNEREQAKIFTSLIKAESELNNLCNEKAFFKIRALDNKIVDTKSVLKNSYLAQILKHSYTLLITSQQLLTLPNDRAFQNKIMDIAQDTADQCKPSQQYIISKNNDTPDDRKFSGLFGEETEETVKLACKASNTLLHQINAGKIGEEKNIGYIAAYFDMLDLAYTIFANPWVSSKEVEMLHPTSSEQISETKKLWQNTCAKLIPKMVCCCTENLAELIKNFTSSSSTSYSLSISALSALWQKRKPTNTPDPLLTAINNIKNKISDWNINSIDTSKLGQLQLALDTAIQLAIDGKKETEKDTLNRIKLLLSSEGLHTAVHLAVEMNMQQQNQHQPNQPQLEENMLINGHKYNIDNNYFN
jgi:hypothetical protein